MGAAIATRFLEEGARLVLSDISERRLTAETATFDPEWIACVRADARAREEAARVMEAGIGKFGRIDVLVNVVGGIRDKELNRRFISMSEQRFNDTFELNLKAIFHFVQLVAPGMLDRGYGKIVNLASINMAGEPGQANYGAAKAAVASLTRTLAMELAPNINVNCISPATIRTSVLDRMAEDEREYYRGKTILKRFGEPREVAHAALFLASDEADYITGENLCVSGGVAPAL